VVDDPVVRRVATNAGATPAQVGLAWLLAHAPNILLIPGTANLAHLNENVAAGSVQLSDDHLADLDAILSPGGPSSAGSSY
jgi:aryl-alcohol dehydrogenase-like predicted oxidoreductase